MEDFLGRLPLWLTGIVVVGGITAISVLGLLLVRWRFSVDSHESHNQIAGDLFSAVTQTYAVFLVFLAITVFQQFDHAEQLVSEEAATVVALQRASIALPEDVRRETQNRLRLYVRSVIDVEWATMANGKASPETEARFEDLWNALEAFRPANEFQLALFTDSLTRLADLTRARNLRITASNGSLPGIYWVLLIAGALPSIGFAYFFDLPSVRAHCMMIAGFAALVGVILLLLIAVNRPFTGEVRVQPLPLVQAITLIDGQAR